MNEISAGTVPARKDGKIKKAFLAAFPHTIPIFAGFWFLGITYGIYMNVSGFSFWYPMLMSLTIFAGSVEFVAVNMLLGAFNPLQALAMTLMINARHLFYGLSMLDRYRGTGWKKFYLIFGMCRREFFYQLLCPYPGRRRLRMVHVLCNTAQSDLLVYGGYLRRHLRFPDHLQHRRA